MDSRKEDTNKSISKTEISPYGLKQRCRLQFPMPTDRRKHRWHRHGSCAPPFRQYRYDIGFTRESNAAPVTPREPIFTKGEKTCRDSRPTRMQNFTPLALSAAEKSVTVQTKNKQKNTKLECGPMPNVMVALPNTGGALCSTPQSLADAHY